MEDPLDPLAAIRLPVESLGGHLLNAYFTEDSYDVLAITEFPDVVSPDDIFVAFYAGGAVAAIHSSPLLTAAQVHDAKRKSGTHSYRTILRSHSASA
jgi:uncharacterized protein with GYD domain